MGMAVIHWGMCYRHQREIPNTVLQLLQEALSMEQQWRGKIQIPIHSQKVQHLDQYLSNQVS